MDLTAIAVRSLRLRTPLTAKFWKIMRLTAVFLFAASLHVAATGLSQKVTLNVKNAPLKTVFVELNKQTGYNFLYADETLAKASAVTLKVKDVSLADVLALCFKDQPLGFTIENNSIVIKSKIANPTKEGEATSHDSRLTIDVRGRLLNESSEPVPGASIKVKGTTNGTTTNANGEFTLTGVDENATLVFSGTNIETFEKKIGTSGDLGTITAKIKISPLDEIQIQAYGTTNRRIGTGNISTVKAKDIEKQPVNNPLLAIQGRVPGIFISQATGLPGTGVTVRIQGQNSLSKGNDPLYVIDGVPFTSQLLPSINGILGNSGSPFFSGNPLNFINSSDIESVDVLKDADATSIYGSRAANGAILITTKKGKAGQTRVSVNAQTGWGKVTRKLDLLNTQQFLEMRREAKKNDNAGVLSTDYDINGTWDTTRYTDWQDELIGGTARYNDIQVSVSGGNASTQFLLSSGFHKETTVYPSDMNDQKASFHFNVGHTSVNQKFRLQFSGNYMLDNNRLIDVDLTGRATTLAPNAPALYNNDGTLNWAQLSNGRSTWANPLASLTRKYKNKTNNLISNLEVGYHIIPGLELKSTFSYTDLESNEISLGPIISEAPENRAVRLRQAIFGTSSINSWIIEPQITYKRMIGKGKIEALIGSTRFQSNADAQQIAAAGQNSDYVLEDIKSATIFQANSSVKSTYNYAAVFGRVNYNLLDRYIINLNARRDGSSRFGSKNLFHNFASIGAAWIFSSEKIFQNKSSILSYGKIRASYGTTGNDQIGDYAFMNLYSAPGGVGAPYQDATGLLPTGLPNPYLQWEETRKLQVGLDLGFFNNRILLNSGYYYNRSSNQLESFALPIITGFGGIVMNFPATIQNSGWELSLSTTNLHFKDFEWTSTINLTVPKNKLVKFPNLATSSKASSLIIGEPISIIKVYHFLGVNQTTGIYQFADLAGNPTSTPNSSTDKTVIIKTAPVYYGGFQNAFKFKSFELDVFFQFVKQTGANYLFGNRPGRSINQPISVLQRWQKSGDITSIQKYNSNNSISTQYGYAYESDAGYSNASYIRLKNLSLSWQLPKNVCQKLKLQGWKFYVHGQNLITITKFKGMDPENATTNTLPPLKVLTIGTQLSL